MNAKLRNALGLFVALILASCTSVGERTVVSVGYYTVTGETFGELDKNIRLHGPNVTGVGKALASTDLRMVPNIKFARKGGGCVVSEARINVKARVTLPRHANENRLKKDLAKAWNNLQEYARVHEAVHLAIADRFALIMEDEISNLKPQRTCTEMRTDVQSAFTKLFQEHHAEQLKFDADEKTRIQKLIAESRNS
ncbi:MAG: DUF922 domain-containing protein [Pseudomonadota bacterium]